MENLSNGYQSTLNGAINSSVTSVVVNSISGAPAANFRIIIDSEIMLVTAIAPTTFTVTRGIESTLTASHSSGAIVTQIVTLGGLLQYISDRFPLSAGGTLNVRIAPITADTDGSTITFDCSANDWHSVTLGGNRILALSNVSVGQQITLRLKQDATGSRTVTWFSTITWFTSDGLAPTLSSAANKITVVTLKCTSSGNYDGFLAGSQA